MEQARSSLGLDAGARSLGAGLHLDNADLDRILCVTVLRGSFVSGFWQRRKGSSRAYVVRRRLAAERVDVRAVCDAL